MSRLTPGRRRADVIPCPGMEKGVCAFPDGFLWDTRGGADTHSVTDTAYKARRHVSASLSELPGEKNGWRYKAVSEFYIKW